MSNAKNELVILNTEKLMKITKAIDKGYRSKAENDERAVDLNSIDAKVIEGLYVGLIKNLVKYLDSLKEYTNNSEDLIYLLAGNLIHTQTINIIKELSKDKKQDLSYEN